MAGPVITEDYQRKLENFITAVPLYYGDRPGETGEVRSMGKGSKTLNTQNGKFTADDVDAIKADIKTNTDFQRMTGYTHYDLVKKWVNDRTTTCNEFCSKCAVAMGYTSKDGVGKFDIADWLTRYGLGHCWVRRAARRPCRLAAPRWRCKGPRSSARHSRVSRLTLRTKHRGRRSTTIPANAAHVATRVASITPGEFAPARPSAAGNSPPHVMASQAWISRGCSPNVCCTKLIQP